MAGTQSAAPKKTQTASPAALRALEKAAGPSIFLMVLTFPRSHRRDRAAPRGSHLSHAAAARVLALGTGRLLGVAPARWGFHPRPTSSTGLEGFRSSSTHLCVPKGRGAFSAEPTRKEHRPPSPIQEVSLCRKSRSEPRGNLYWLRHSVCLRPALRYSSSPAIGQPTTGPTALPALEEDAQGSLTHRTAIAWRALFPRSASIAPSWRSSGGAPGGARAARRSR